MDIMFPYQQRVLKDIAPDAYVRAIFLHYGAGKSWIALEHAIGKHDPTYSQRLIAIIFCKKRNIPTWRTEILKRCPRFNESTLAPKIIEGKPPWGLPFTYDRPTFLLISHHNIYTWEKEIATVIGQSNPRTLILDESTAIKNPKTKRTLAALRLARIHEDNPIIEQLGGTRLILTGNPKPEGEHEIWSQIQFAYGSLNPFGDTYYRFLHRWFTKTDFAWALNLETRDLFYRTLRQCSAELTDTELRDFIEAVGIRNERYCIEYYDESHEQRTLLNKLYDTWSLPDGAGGEQEFEYTMQIQQKAQQIASGFYYSNDGKAMYLKQNPKLQLLVQVVGQLLTEIPHRKIIVWHHYKAELPGLVSQLEYQGVVVGPVEEALLEFQENSHTHILVMPVTISQGFNELKHADTNIFYSNVYSQESRNQAESRIKRLGSTHSVATHIDLCSPRMADIEIVTALQSKSLSPARMKTIVNQYCKDRKEGYVKSPH